MSVALVFPPTCDPTAPYISIPLLTGFLRAQGVDVLPLDANVEGWTSLLREEFLERCARMVEARLSALDALPGLRHSEQVQFAQLWRALSLGQWVPSAVPAAISLMKGKEGKGFFSRARYSDAVATLEAAQALIGAAHSPLALSFTQYRTPFSLQGLEEIARDACSERNPFHEFYVESLLSRLEGRRVLGISVVFPGQIQQAFALAMLARERMPSLHVTAGGPAITQLFMRLPEEQRGAALGPFHSIVLFEGERALLDLVERVEAGAPPSGLIYGEKCGSLAGLPPPDFQGLPLDLYLSPEIVLPYDPTRGCYWGKCAFCHYGLAEQGTARYRERPAEEAAAHLGALSQRHGARIFHLSQDAFAPAAARRLGQALQASHARVRWASDVRPERVLTAELCQELAQGGALAFSFGVESGNERVLKLINKGVSVSDVSEAVRNAAAAGIAVEAMCFTEFPTESGEEAIDTIDFVKSHREHLSLFICGEFHLVAGSAVARSPGHYGIRKVWHAAGDVFRAMMFYEEKRESKSDADAERLERALAKASSLWHLSHYPWAGALSTAHTLLWYQEKGCGAFRRERQDGKENLEKKRPTACRREMRYDVDTVLATADGNEAAIWGELVWERRDVSRRAYEGLAQECPILRPRHGKTVPKKGGRDPRERRGRR